MPLRQIVTSFYKAHVTFSDRIFLAFVTFGLISGISLLLLNRFDFHYTAIPLFLPNVPFLSIIQVVLSLLFGCALLIQGMYTRLLSPRSSCFMLAMGFFFCALLINLLFATALQSTPFPPIDQTLAKIDQWMGIDTPSIMAWTHHHPHLHHLFQTAYHSLILQLILSPFLLGLFNTRKSLSVFFIAEVSTFLIGGFIYYFFPTTAPSGIFHSPYFSIAQHDTSMRFYDLHHFLKVPTDKGGLIAFPSFHVVWAILICYAWINKKIIFYPLVFFNLIVIASTVFLGWHYFTDVIGGGVLAIAGIVFAEWAWKKSVATDQNKRQ
ncbi:MAG: hypothetical protein COY58_02590 [Gammaproteobacteria bacterium CG_4_10_14_0_8_um_filter_38_16]|nr:MAG: hypothetical protein COY58_02590 [Gammaproteobacteria bacterium CG_4_10_14_0_8_um_filter_38_16]PJA03821.1 MAG: hypothetical protein COX72_02750 [Gammaproteobacteria bacterium CG_4_10_14_0_2_um_filter_38_22]PJB10795.1 MAG: hypothetical protein CO120_02855 [Gammaproteobacteria bacterium CG_4_9_14_3_um_filter_38_9]